MKSTIAVATGLLLGTTLSAWAGEAPFKRLSAAAIRAAAIGKTVTDEAHWADRFLPDGTLQVEVDYHRDGVAVATGLLRESSP